MKFLLTAQTPPTGYIHALSTLGAGCALANENTSEEEFDGLILCGGGDPDPALYNQPLNGSRSILPDRDMLELNFIHKFLKTQKPILGICRGMQILNIAFGGSLIQHLPTAHLHQTQNKDCTHLIKTNGVLQELLGKYPLVNSNHHQAVARLGRGFHAVAVSEDGVIEAIVHQRLPILGVQFHPERMDNGKPIFGWLCSQMK